MEKTEIMYHIGLSKLDIEGARFAILPGDPGRVQVIAERLENPKKLEESREYTSYLGEISGKKVLVISTGMGGASTAICVEELSQIGITHLIRVGTCGGMQLDVEAGDLVIAQAAIRQEGTSKEYLPIEYPAVADIDLVFALRNASCELGYRTHTGVVHCKDSFYGQHEPSRMPVGYELQNKWNAWILGGALASEMETSSLYTVSSVLKLHAAAILLVVWNQEREKASLDNQTDYDTTREIEVAILAIKNMILNSK